MSANSFSNCNVVEVMGGENIARLLECPVCQGVPTPPIWTCVSGHIVCNECRPHLRPQVCGLCRKPLEEGRNFFMEAVVNGSVLTCPHADEGCDVRTKGEELKSHAAGCSFGPKIKWVTYDPYEQSYPASEMVLGGHQNGVNLYVVRSSHMGSTSPGKLFEYTPPGADPDTQLASICWGGGEHPKSNYEVLIAKRGWYEWVSSKNGNLVKGAVKGGMSEDNEPLFIGRFLVGSDLVIGKIHPSHKVCYVGYERREKASTTYEILVEVKLKSADPSNASSSSRKAQVELNANSDESSMYS